MSNWVSELTPDGLLITQQFLFQESVFENPGDDLSEAIVILV